MMTQMRVFDASTHLLMQDVASVGRSKLGLTHP
jgi:hypothetical protein